MDKEQFETKLKSLIRSNLIHLPIKAEETTKVVDHLYDDITNFFEYEGLK